MAEGKANRHCVLQGPPITECVNTLGRKQTGPINWLWLLVFDKCWCYLRLSAEASHSCVSSPSCVAGRGRSCVKMFSCPVECASACVCFSRTHTGWVLMVRAGSTFERGRKVTTATTVDFPTLNISQRPPATCVHDAAVGNDKNPKPRASVVRFSSKKEFRWIKESIFMVKTQSYNKNLMSVTIYCAGFSLICRITDRRSSTTVLH